MQGRPASWVACVVALIALASPARALPPGFSQSGIGGAWSEVAGLTFSQDGTRLYVVERGGKVWIVENGIKLSTPFLDISDEVGGWRDFGLLGFALHPNFDSNGLVYALYVVDRYHLFNFGTPGYLRSNLETQQQQATIGRISRFTADPATGMRTILPGSQVILLGDTPEDGVAILHESHGTGQLVFGQDGTLLATNGDGASYDSTDVGSASETYFEQALDDGIIEPFENVGAWRSQLIGSLNGKLLRLDPLTGDGVSGNPWFEPAAPRSPRSRTFALGLRNPYRFTLRPGTGSHDPSVGNPGTLYIGDVGWGDSEDLQILEQAGQNFGWPAFEGMDHRGVSSTSSYWSADTAHPLARNPLASQPGCTVPFLRFRDLIDQESQNPADPPRWPNPCNPAVPIPDEWTDPSNGTVYRYDKFVHSRPPIAWRSNAWVATWSAAGDPTFATMGTGTPVSGPNFSGNTSTGGVWHVGTDFPPEWRNRYYHGDFGAGWIKSFAFDPNDRLFDVDNFVDPGNAVTFVATNPVSGGIYYVKWGDRVRRIRWVGTGNSPPIAVATPEVSWDTGPELTVQFDASGTSDPDAGATLSYAWDFGDGATSALQNPQHTFVASGTEPETFVVRLTVTDEDSNLDDADLWVSLNNSPPSVEITSPVDGSPYTMAGPMSVAVTSSVIDAEHPPESLACELLLERLHNDHAHAEPIIPACSADLVLTPAGCDGNSYAWRFTLTVSEPFGLSASDSVQMLPDCTTLDCGDAVLDAPEQCDDGDLAAADGCNEFCRVEPGWSCAGQPSVCQRCGDGVLQGSESCDDGNLEAGDCCSALCAFEPTASPCPADANFCSRDVCDGAGVCIHPDEPDGTVCGDGDPCTGPDQCGLGVCGGLPLPDLDSDGSCDEIDADDDGDGVADSSDAAPHDRLVCRDVDADGCDDCSSGADAPAGDGPDADADGRCDAGDNCRFTPNDQTDSGGVAFMVPDGIGNACQCGDLDVDGSVLESDVSGWRATLADQLAPPPGFAELCNVHGTADCDLADLVVMRRALVGADPGVGAVCAANLP